MGAKVEASVDYLEATVPYECQGDLLERVGGAELLRDKRGQVRGWRGYTHSGFIAQGQGRIGWSPDDQRMGCHVSLGSGALGVLAELDDRWRDLPGVMGYVLQDLGGHCTRVDVAWDDFEGLVTMERIGSALREGRYVSRARKWKYYLSSEPTKQGPVTGETYYLGSPKSDTQLRIYDKRAERLQKGHQCDAEHWTRVETQYRRKRADAVGRLWARVNDDRQAVMTHLAGVLRSFCEFKVPSTDTNKQRQPIAGWWAEFLGWAAKARLAVVQGEARTIEDVKQWIALQVAPSLALLEDSLGFDAAWSFLYAEAQEGRARYSSRHRAVVSASVVG